MDNDTIPQALEQARREQSRLDERRNIPKTSEDTKHPQFTEQQITDYCEKVENLCFSCRPEGKLLFAGVQIIKQLQELLAKGQG